MERVLILIILVFALLGGLAALAAAHFMGPATTVAGTGPRNYYPADFDCAGQNLNRFGQALLRHGCPG